MNEHEEAKSAEQVAQAAEPGQVEQAEHEKPPVISSERVFQGGLISVRVDKIALPEGRVATREVVDHPGAVVMAAVDGEGCIYLVWQYRHAIAQRLLELPAGKLEPGEEPLLAAKRELAEEVGLKGRLWTLMGTVYSSPGFVNERLYVYLARGLTPVERHPDDDEDLTVVRYELSDLLANLQMVEDSKTLAALCLLRHKVIAEPVEDAAGD